MAMLAEPRRRKRYCLNPRGKALYEDDSRFGTKMLEKMGWSKGKGLGAKENGSLDFVRVRFKDDAEGLGYAGTVRDDQWTAHEESFNGLLKSLNGDAVDSSNSNESNSNNIDHNSDDELRPMGFGFKINTDDEPQKKKHKLKENTSGVSLEEKSKSSKARVHYKKFTRGKDLSRYSEKDLANIFGKKATDEQTDNVYEQFTALSSIELTEIVDKDVQSNFAGVQTIQTGLSVSDYFKEKMEAFKNRKANGITKTDITVKQQSTSNEEENIQQVITENDELPKKSKKKRKKLDDHVPEVVECVDEELKPKKKKKKQKDLLNSETELLELPQLDESLTDESKSKKKKKSKQKELDATTEILESNTELLPESKDNETSQKTKKNKKSKDEKEFVSVECKRKSDDTSNDLEEKISDAVANETIPVKKKKHKKNKLEPTVDACNLTAEQETAEVANKSEKKNKKNKLEPSSSENVSENLQIKEIPNDISSNEKSDSEQATPTETGELLSMENLLKKRDSFDIYTISSFCAEKFRHCNMKAFKGSELHKIPGYGIDANIKLNIVYQPSDEKRILDLWNNTNTKYSTSFRYTKNFGTHLKKLKKTNKFKEKNYHLQTFKRRNAFAVI